MSLLAVQRAFAAELRAAAVPETPGMRIHQNNYRSALAACLADAFARTREWIGDDAFEEAVAHHVDRLPPSSWTLDAYPRDFPDTLDSLYAEDREVGELAWLELALAEAFVGPDADPLSPAIAAQTDWDSALLLLAPTIDLHPLTTNAAKLWSALTARETPPVAEPLPETGALLVWRQGDMSNFRAIDGLEEQAILLVRSGLSFANLCAMLVEARGDEDGVALAGTYLGRWLTDGLIVAITDGG